MFEIVVFTLYFWFIYHFLPAGFLSLSIWVLGRRRAKWMWWEFSILVVPFLFWATLLFTYDTGKSPRNIIEIFWLACMLPLAAVVRVAIGQRLNPKVVAASLIGCFSIVAIVLYLVVAPIDKN